MVFETTMQERAQGPRRASLLVLTLGVAVLLGAVLMQVNGSRDFSGVTEALQVPQPAGDDWHGNVRRSAP